MTISVATMHVDTVLAHYRPATHDTPEGPNLEWTWPKEAHDMWMNSHVYMRQLLQHIWVEGIQFHDHVQMIELGNDGRVWDGHHRLVIAAALMIPTVNCEVHT